MAPSGKRSCCAPPKGAEPLSTSAPAELGVGNLLEFETIEIPAAKRPVLGTSRPIIPNDGEELRRASAIRAFKMMSTTVTNAQFAAFVDDTGYVTEAERFGWSFVFWSEVPASIPMSQAVAGIEWWRKIDGSNWRDITGPGTESEVWYPDHPVVQVSWNDAKAFAAWAGGRLPSEAEWEHAARGGLDDVPYPWGSKEPDDVDYQPCNIWQGRFPERNTCADGYATTAPARSFEPNGYGLFNVVGNVWEWTSDAYRIHSLKKAAKERMKAMTGYKVAKGGSYLCHSSYCWRYRVAARSGNSPDSSTPHMGFRLVF